MKNTFGEIFFRQAVRMAAERELAESLRCAQRAHALGNPSAAEIIGLCYYELGDLAQAERFLDESHRETVRQERATVQEMLRAVENWVQRGNYRKALKALQFSHPTVRLLTLRGCLYARIKSYRHASECFAEALKLDHHNEEALAFLSDVGARKQPLLGGMWA